MSINMQRDGSIVLVSDVNTAVTQLLSPGQTPAQVAAAYSAFIIQNPQPAPSVDPIMALQNAVSTLQAQVAALQGVTGATGAAMIKAS